MSETESAGPNRQQKESVRIMMLEDLNMIQGIRACLSTEDRAPTIAEQRALERRDGLMAALARLESDKYGICAKCGGPIPEKRLVAHPTATCCVPCAQQLHER